MNHDQTLVEDNIRYLEQALCLLREIEDSAYSRRSADCFGSSVGGHIRHNLDHYRSFLDGLDSGQVDYDARARDPRLETETEHAMQHILNLIAELSLLSPQEFDTPLRVKLDSGSSSEGWHRSTVGRELQFLVSHTVHHYALVAVILRLRGIEVPSDFGVAPSTLRYHRQQPSCVPQPG